MNRAEAPIHLLALSTYPLIALSILLSLLGVPPGFACLLSVAVLWMGLLTGLEMLRQQVIAGSAREAKVMLRRILAADRGR